MDELQLQLQLRRRQRQQRVPVPRQLGEVLGYIGGMFATVAALLVAGQTWPHLGAQARITLLAVTVAVLTAGGWWARHPASLRRLGMMLWFAAVATVAGLTEIVAEQVQVLHRSEAIEYLTVALAATAAATLFWSLRPSGLQQVALIATVTALVGVITAGHGERAPGLWGGTVWALGLCWLLLGAGRMVNPPGTAAVVGALALLAGPEAGRATGPQPDTLWPASLWLALGLVSAAALVTAGVVARRTALLGIGAAGLFLFLIQAVLTWFGKQAGAPLALLVGGGGLLVVAALVLRAGSSRAQNP